jgi:hypothetical protein
MPGQRGELRGIGQLVDGGGGGDAGGRQNGLDGEHRSILTVVERVRVRPALAAGCHCRVRPPHPAIYKYHHKARFKYNGPKVTAWGSRSDYTSNEQDVVQVGERMRNEKSRVPATSAT